MHGSNIAAAIASIAESIEAALVAGRPTAGLRRELATLEQWQRTEAAEAAAAERARRAEQEEQERAGIHVRASALLDEVRSRIASKMAPLALPPAISVRRYPDGGVETVEITTENDA